MADEETREQTEPRIPTMEDMRAIAEEAARAAIEASDETGRAGRDAAEREARERGIDLPDSVLAQIGQASAQGVIAALEERGAFADPAPNEKVDETAPPEQQRNDEEPQPKKTFAQRYLGQ